MAKKNNVVYLPAYPTNADLVKAVNQLDAIPPYPDRGVRFEGYYKIQKSSKEYELKNQDKFYITNKVLGAGTATAYNNQTDKTIYITGIFCSYNVATPSASNSISLSLSSDAVGTSVTSNLLTIPCIKTADSFFIDFSSAPFKITTLEGYNFVRSFWFNAVGGANDSCTYYFIGFTED